MPGQKKSALTAATVQSANNNIICINFNAKSSESQGLANVVRLYENLNSTNAGKLIINRVINAAEKPKDTQPRAKKFIH